MRKFMLAISIATASLMVSACNKPAEAPKDEATTVDATQAMAPVADANAADANAADAKMAGPDAAVANNTAKDKDDDKGGDPGSRK
jgi:hypothetical protein